MFCSPQNRTACAVLIALLFTLVGSACSPNEPETAGPKACLTDSPASDAELELLPPDLPLTKWGTVTKVAEQRGYVGARAITETTIVELYPQLSKHIRLNGFQTISGENEGFEAEIFFARGRNTGTFLLREGPCRGQVTIRLLFGAAPAVTPTPPSAPPS